MAIAIEKSVSQQHFDLKRDIAVTGDDGFFCEACLVDKPAAEKSPDPRYCQLCYDFLLKEVETITGCLHANWKPQRGTKPIPPIPQNGGGVLSTVESKKPEVSDHQIEEKRHEIQTRHIIPLGRPSADLPMDKVLSWRRDEELGVRAIAKRLNSQGFKVSRMAVHRAIKKEEAKAQLELPI